MVLVPEVEGAPYNQFCSCHTQRPRIYGLVKGNIQHYFRFPVCGDLYTNTRLIIWPICQSTTASGGPQPLHLMRFEVWVYLANHCMQGDFWSHRNSCTYLWVDEFVFTLLNMQPNGHLKGHECSLVAIRETEAQVSVAAILVSAVRSQEMQVLIFVLCTTGTHSWVWWAISRRFRNETLA